MKTLTDLGWNDAFEREFAPHREQGWVPGRLIRDNKISYAALYVMDGAFEEVTVILSGKVYHDAVSDAELPAVGDWVALDLGGKNEEVVIRARLSRQSCLSRKVPGDSSEEQVMAANVSIVVVVTDAGVDYNPHRMERYFMLIARCGAKPLVLINKSDLYPASQCEEVAAEIRAMSDAVEVLTTCVIKRRGLKPLIAHLQKGETIAIIGSSGVGKSELVNYLLGGEYAWTGEVNEVTGKGRHTTSARELMVLKKGGIIIDNPGIKEVQMWTDEKTLRERFQDIAELALNCKYGNCKHGKDAGCAIRAAVEGGALDELRYEGFLKLDEEIEQLGRRMKKRQMTIERITKRDHTIKARNPEDRRRMKNELKPKRTFDGE
jgi:ribosome biogenesis GTPase